MENKKYLVVDKSKCLACAACVHTCPFDAITLDEEGLAFIDTEKCQMCGQCRQICPAEAIEKKSVNDN